MRPPNAPAKWFSIPPSPATRKSSPILPIPARSSFSPIPQIGNYGANDADNESGKPYIEGLVVREFSSARQQLARGREAAQHFSPTAASPSSPESIPARWCAISAPAASCAASCLPLPADPAAWSKSARNIPVDGRPRSRHAASPPPKTTNGPKASTAARPPNSSAPPPSRASTSSPTISASSATSCAGWSRSAAA